MVTRKKKVFIIVALALLGAGFAVFLLTRDSGPSVVVRGNFSAKDVAQIKSAVKRELWRETFTNCSIKNFKELPRAFKNALTVHVRFIGPLNPDPNDLTNHEAYVVCWGNSTNISSFGLTNAPGGWIMNGLRFPSRFFQSLPFEEKSRNLSGH